MQAVDIKICKFNIALFLRAALLMQPVMLLFYQENGLSVKELFFFQGLFYLTSLIFEIPAGYLSDTISRKRVLIISFIIFLSINVLWLFCHGYYAILTGEILFAISKVMMDNSMSGYLYDYINFDETKKSMVKYFGYLNFYLAAGTALAALAGTCMYSKYGADVILISEIFLISISIFLVISLPSIKPPSNKVADISQKIKKFLSITNNLYQNASIKYYVYYSGLLTSFSILFALSFQPVMQNALFPIFLYGVVAFFNHAVRGFAGVAAGKWFRNFDIKKMVVLLFLLYVIAFMCIFEVLSLKNVMLVTLLLFLICIIIGIQLIFTILHVSRLHGLVPIDGRGSLMAVNNFVSRILAAFVLIFSKIFIDKCGLYTFFLAAFCIFLISCSYFMVKILKE